MHKNISSRQINAYCLEWTEYIFVEWRGSSGVHVIAVGGVRQLI
jgi:hypothetical protein